MKILLQTIKQGFKELYLEDNNYLINISMNNWTINSQRKFDRDLQIFYIPSRRQSRDRGEKG